MCTEKGQLEFFIQESLSFLMNALWHILEDMLVKYQRLALKLHTIEISNLH